MKISINKRYLLFLFLFYTFLFNEPLSNVISLFGYEDELFAVLAIPIFFLYTIRGRKAKNRTGSAAYIIGFVICSLLGSLVYQYQSFFKAALPDLLLCTKFWLCLYTAKELFRNFDISKFANKIFMHVKFVAWIYVILTAGNIVFGIFPYLDVRFGLRSNSLFYSHPTTLVSCCSFLIVIALALKKHVKNCFFYVGLLSLVMCSTLRSKAFADVLIFVMIYFFAVVRKQKFSLKSLLPFVPAVILIGWSQIEYYFVELSSRSARSQLLLKSIEVANDHFPLGAGFATYGSHYSSVYYSPLYSKYGLSTIYGLSKSYPAFINDSFWPMILSQSGYFGMVFYILALIALVKKTVQLKKTDVYFFASGLSAICYLLVESAAATAFVHPSALPIAMWLGILLPKVPSKCIGNAMVEKKSLCAQKEVQL